MHHHGHHPPPAHVHVVAPAPHVHVVAPAPHVHVVAPAPHVHVVAPTVVVRAPTVRVVVSRPPPVTVIASPPRTIYLPPAGFTVHVAPPGYPSPFPQFRGPVVEGLYYKPIWTIKREQKLAKLYNEVMADGVLEAKEMKHVLKKFGYHVSDEEAMWVLASMDLNHDGNISYDEFRFGIQSFCVSWPRIRAPGKMPKAYHYPGYNWLAHPEFPRHLQHLWRPIC
eukprot:TRINITY_DN181_c0_g1_i12.p2 TRINITY_DN181_c0_g1~~TRINITY_DN181_c0_g1_i12.p2  ORF type:complete len:223 (+),score=57.70 TRINITY_DN181_c0_g1_i12:99-767(+)